MNKQEEIKKTMIESAEVYLSPDYAKGLVNTLLVYLHSQGVVIKTGYDQNFDIVTEPLIGTHQDKR